MRRLACSLVPVLALGCESTQEDPLMRMGVQPKVKVYQASSFWPDGRASRHPPQGTVPREALAELPLMDWQDGDGGFKDAFPQGVELTEAFVRRGQRRFDITCATCHGVRGDGLSIAGENMALRPAPSLVALRERPVGYFFEVITHGHGLMPPFAAEVPPAERWAVAAYVRALQLSQDIPLADIPGPERERLLSAPSQGGGRP